MCSCCAKPVLSSAFSARTMRLLSKPHSSPSSPSSPSAMTSTQDNLTQQQQQQQPNLDDELPAGSSAPIPIPGGGASRSTPALPIEGLYALDQHDWDTEVNVLSKWAAGVGPRARSFEFDCFFTPGSPPRRSRQFIN